MTRLRLGFWGQSRILMMSPIIVTASVALSYVNSRLVQPYWLDVTSKATVAVVFLSPGIAAATAMESSRLRLILAGPVMARHPLALVWRILAQAALVGGVALMLSVAAVSVRVGVPSGNPRLGMLGLALLMTVSSASFGLVLGRYVLGVYALPLAFACTWLWLTFPPTIDPYWIRNVNGNLGTSCCSINLELVQNALLAPAIIYAAVLLGAIVILTCGRLVIACTLVVGLLCGSVLVARSMMISTGPDPVVARKGATACSGGLPRVCLWPEEAGSVARAEQLVLVTASRFEASGFRVPHVFTEEEGVPGSWHIDLGHGPDSNWAWDISQAPLAGLPPRCIELTNGRWLAGDVYDVVSIWLGKVAGASPTRPVSGESQAMAGRVMALSPQRQLEWIQVNLETLTSCDTPSMPIPTT